jgi:hypothetical protein
MKKTKEILGIPKKQLAEMQLLQNKLQAIAKILDEPIDVNIGIETLKGKQHLKILNINTKTGLKTLTNPISKLTEAIYGLSSIEKKGDKAEKMNYVG